MAKKINDSDHTKLSFTKYFFPARPKEQINKAKQIAKKQMNRALKIGLPIASNPAYVSWLKQESMLEDSNRLASTYTGKGSMWRNPYAKPQPRKAIKQASVWFTAYPVSLITEDKKSIIATLGDDKLWQAFQKIGIEGLHTGPMKRAGGVKGWKTTPSIDGHFDRISTRIDPIFGTEKEFRNMTQEAAKHNSIIVDDIIPGHTGKGADFRLAEMAYGDYPGIYHMVEIDSNDWHILPDVKDGTNSQNISQETESELKKRGYIIGKLQRVIFYETRIKETNWSATKVVRGVDGVKRRWVYLHYFKDGQPSINWIDPTFAGMRLVIGDALHTIGELGTKGLRLDANGFLGVEVIQENDTAWSESHPLSDAANHFIASMVRKLDGFTFQELNLSFDDIMNFSKSGADLSYDFINRPAYHHALAIEDTEFLQLTLRTSLEMGIDPASLVHALQNHDELTYELIHFQTTHSEDSFEFRNASILGAELAHVIRGELQTVLTGKDNPYNLIFSENGIACTSTSSIAAILGIHDIHNLSDENVEKIKKAHLLIVMFNALQPGVFALSGWDLVGALTLESAEVEELLRDGDTRWINRGAYDLMGVNPSSNRSSSGMPKANSLYGSIAEQLENEDSFVFQLKNILTVRKQYGIARSHQLEIPYIADKRVLCMVNKLRDGDIQVTALNFSGDEIEFNVSSEHFSPNSSAKDMFSEKVIGKVNSENTLTIKLRPHEGTSILLLV